MSSLATQLAQSASLNAGLLVDRSKRRPTESYLFTGKDVDTYDLESIHALGLNGLLQLAKLDPSIKKFQGSLFGESAKGLDRTLLSQDEANALDAKLEQFLQLVGRWIMETPTGCVIEWLVRRFRINEFNIPTVLGVFLPYHESVHFAKMLSILHIKPQTTWAFLLPFKSAAQSLPRIPLVTEMLQHTEVARFIISLLPVAVKAYQEGGPTPHSALLAFNAACAHDFMSRSSKIDEGTAAFLMPAFLLPLTVKNRTQDAMLGSIILLALFSRKCTLSPPALNIIVKAMVEACGVVEQTGTQYVSANQFLKASLSTLEEQEELDAFEERTSQAIIHLKDIDQALKETYMWNGAEKLLRPLLPYLLNSAADVKASTLLESILTSLNVPEAVIERAAMLLIDAVLKHADAVSPSSLSSRDALYILYQRHHSVFTKVCDLLGTSESAVDPNSLDQLRISLSMVPKVRGPIRGSTVAEESELDTALASTNPDARIRVVAVNRLLEALQNSQTSEEDKESARSALLARAQDTNVAVVEALYSTPETILPFLLSNSSTYIDHLTQVLCPPGASIKKNRRPLLRVHFQFLVTYFLQNRSLQQSIRNTIFHKVIFPFLLFSKPRQHTAEAVWTIIVSSPQGNALHEWLTGCTQIIKKEGDQVQVGGTDKMAEVNFAIATSIARNILKSNQYPNHFNDLISKLEDCDSSVRALAYLVGRSLLLQLSGEHQVEAARQMLRTLSLKDLTELGDLERNDSDDIITEAALGKLVITKPSSQSTSRWLQVSLIAATLSIPRPESAPLNWFEQPTDMVPASRGLAYVELLRTIYRAANMLNSAPTLIVSILSTLFETLKTDVLAFLAAIWTNSSPLLQSEITDLRTIALHHGAAFLHAHVLEGDDTDFQTILPGLLVPLQSPDAEQRRIAMACISHLHQLASRKFKRVYGFDTIYGAKTAQVQYLDQQDFGKYVGQLVEHQEHFLQDSSYLTILHQQRLQINKTQKKRDNEYRHRILCFLSSHVAAFATSSAQLALLRSLKSVSDGAKMLSLAPLITCSFSRPTFKLHMQEPEKRELLIALAASFDVSVAQDLNDEAQTSWSIFLSVVCCSLTDSALFDVTARSLKAGLFAALNADRRVLLLNTILDESMENAGNYIVCKQLLGSLLEDVSMMCHMIELYQPAAVGESPRSAKRAKTTWSTKDDSLLRLTLLAEVLAAKPLPGSLDLVSQLLDAMNAILHSSVTQADSDYIEQLLMAAIEESSRNIMVRILRSLLDSQVLIETIKEIPNLSPSNVRLDVLVELLRVAENPQTFHQALLLIANLTRLAPDSVLSNVMPIFTFMGSNVFHRDDTYSFKVVQQTIDNIVPVMVSSLRETNSPGLELFRASKPFIRTFSDASHHIPRHRRLGFFSHLLDVLGVDFLAPLCMLLLERVANRIARQANEDVVSLLQLPQSLLENQAHTVQTQALTDILREAQRLVNRLINPEAASPVLLDTTDDDPDAVLVGLWRRAKTLLIFVGYATKSFTTSSATGETSQLISSLIPLTQSPVSGPIQDKLDDLALTAQTSLQRILESLRASDFISAALSTLRSENSQVYTSGLALLRDRLPEISASTRQGLSSTMVEIIATIQTLMTNDPTPELMGSAFGALYAIATTLSTGEESAMSGTIQRILKAIKRGECIASALKVLTSLPSKLGPRIIPYYREIVDQCMILIREEEPDVVEDACATIRGLLVSIPTFWGAAEVIKTVSLIVNSPENRSKSLNTQLTKAVVKHIPAAVVLPALVQIWEEPWLNNSPQRTVYMEILQKTLRNASRPVVLEQLKPTFKVLLSSFDFAAEDRCLAEIQTISAFRELVVKLNEAAFRSLFRRLYDWAFANDATAMRKKVVFCHLYSSLLEYFKGLMTPYLSIALDSFLLALETLDHGISGYEEFWLGILQTLTQSLEFDESTFWKDDKLRRLSGPLIQQVAVCARLKSSEAKSAIQDCLSAVVEATSDDTILKNLNLHILMHTRSEEAKIRQTALTCAESLWRNHGNKLSGLVAETTTFIAECSEDENDMVVKESFRLKDAVENAAGSIDGLLDR